VRASQLCAGDVSSERARESVGVDAAPEAVWYARASHKPAPDLDLVPGDWRADTWPSERTSWVEHPLIGKLPYAVKPDVGTAAWISCAGHLPYGQPYDQRHDDADSLTWYLDPESLEIAGHPHVLLRLTSSAPVATVTGVSARVLRRLSELPSTRGVAALAAPPQRTLTSLSSSSPSKKIFSSSSIWQNQQPSSPESP